MVLFHKSFCSERMKKTTRILPRWTISYSLKHYSLIHEISTWANIITCDYYLGLTYLQGTTEYIWMKIAVVFQFFGIIKTWLGRYLIAVNTSYNIRQIIFGDFACRYLLHTLEWLLTFLFKCKGSYVPYSKISFEFMFRGIRVCTRW